ncbi:hypothetical protein BC941DRAFT_424941 [Chlamydoabsidia padenii]|nr:hypothetical protein BC941DRAFT_424941 [Chlamydoabsidia padenii]
MENNINITAELSQFRKQSIDVAQSKSSLSPLRILSLSHIFPVNRYNKDLSVTRYMKLGGKELVSLAYKDVGSKKASAEGLIYVHSIQHAIIEGTSTEEITTTTKNEVDKGINNIIKCFLGNSNHINTHSEQSFTDSLIMPFVQNIFVDGSDDDLIYNLADGSQQRGKTKPDVMIGIKIKKADVYLIFIEVKRPLVSSKYQAEDDFTKLMKHLKTSINIQIKLGIQEPVSIGVLCEGFDCSMYEMKLIEEGIYLPVLVCSFCLVKDNLSLMNLVGAVEAFTLAKDIVDRFPALLANKNKANLKLNKFRKESFITKVKK